MDQRDRLPPAAALAVGVALGQLGESSYMLFDGEGEPNEPSFYET